MRRWAAPEAADDLALRAALRLRARRQGTAPPALLVAVLDLAQTARYQAARAAGDGAALARLAQEATGVRPGPQTHLVFLTTRPDGPQ
jgi:hypothetical protein